MVGEAGESPDREGAGARERIVSGLLTAEDVAAEEGLRPYSLEEFIGQARTKELLSIYITAALERGESLDHVLLSGPPGLGKTTLAHVIAHELNVNVRVTSGPAVERPGDLAAILTNLEEKDVLFIDEIHRLSRTVEEVLYPAMEDYALDIVMGKGAGARSLRLSLPRFTLVGATTRTGMLTSPLRDRFGVTARLDYYGTAELAEVVMRAARIIGISVDEAGAEEIARRSRGTPRVANRLLRRLRDFAQVRADGAISLSVAREGLVMLAVDDLGLDETDLRLMRALVEKFGGGPTGLDTLAAATGEEPETIEDVCEPYLIQIGFLQRTPRGRTATRAAFRHLGAAPPEAARPDASRPEGPEQAGLL